MSAGAVYTPSAVTEPTGGLKVHVAESGLFKYVKRTNVWDSEAVRFTVAGDTVSGGTRKRVAVPLASELAALSAVTVIFWSADTVAGA